jgi:hypothetical protein
MAKKKREKDQERTLRDLSPKERYAAEKLLYGRRRDGPRPFYDPDVHPKAIVQYFKERFDQIRDATEYATEHRLEYVANPARPPTLSGFAASIGVGRETLWSWALKHEEFGEAVDLCKAMQEAMIIELTAIGAYNPSFAALMMKNMHKWADKVEADVKSSVTLNFDEQDADA